jgi:hypothetical protein
MILRLGLASDEEETGCVFPFFWFLIDEEKRKKKRVFGREKERRNSRPAAMLGLGERKEESRVW